MSIVGTQTGIESLDQQPSPCNRVMKGFTMPPMQSIHRPDGDATLDNAVEAIRPSFDDLEKRADVSVEAAAGPEMSDTFALREGQKASLQRWPSENWHTST
jgi:hypothetical protein